jgi:hypothetical protein
VLALIIEKEVKWNAMYVAEPLQVTGMQPGPSRVCGRSDTDVDGVRPNIPVVVVGQSMHDCTVDRVCDHASCVGTWCCRLAPLQTDTQGPFNLKRPGYYSVRLPVPSQRAGLDLNFFAK